jgi:plastocyanin
VAGAKVAQRARAKRAAESERLRTARHPAVSARPAPLDWQLICKAAAACFLVSAALIHAIWTALHLREGLLEGVFFLLTALAQGAMAFGLLTFPNRRTYLMTSALSLGIVAVWALSRTVGLPIGHEAATRQPVGMPDLIATVFEWLTVLTVLPLVVARGVPGRKRQPTGERWARTYALVGGLGLYTLAFTAVAVVPAVTGHGSESATEASGADISAAAQSHASHPDGADGASGSAPSAADAASDGASGSAPSAAVHLPVQRMSFGTKRLTMAAGRQVMVHLDNRDDAPHNFSVYRDARFEGRIFKGDIIKGGSSETYEFESPKPGRYWFRCDAHPFMSGEVIFS